MKILISGGAGFVGSNLSLHFLKTQPKASLYIIDNLSAGYEAQIDLTNKLDQRKNYQFFEHDIRDDDWINQTVQGIKPDMIINCIYSKNEKECVQNFIQTNLNLLSASVKHLPNLEAFIYFSSDEVYGDIAPEEGLLKSAFESLVLKPKTAIAAAQAGADLLTSSFFEQHQIPTTVLRTSNLFGPYQNPDRLIPRLIEFALNNQDIPVYDQGTHSRDWLYIQDLVDFVDKLLQQPKSERQGEIYNLSGELEKSVLEITEIILAILNKPKELISIQPDKKPTIKRRTIDSSKARSAFAWTPQEDLKQAMQKTIDWYRSKPDTLN